MRREASGQTQADLGPSTEPEGLIGFLSVLIFTGFDSVTLTQASTKSHSKPFSWKVFLRCSIRAIVSVPKPESVKLNPGV